MSNVATIKIGNYTIRHNGVKAIAFDTRDTKNTQTFEGVNNLQDARDWCKGFKAAVREDWSEVNKTVLNFNIQFMSDIIGDGSFYFKIEAGTDGPVLITSSTKKEGFNYAGNKSTEVQETLCACAHYSPKVMSDLGFNTNARYALVETTEPGIFEFALDSLITHSRDSVRLGIPGVSVNSYYSDAHLANK